MMCASTVICGTEFGSGPDTHRLQVPQLFYGLLCNTCLSIVWTDAGYMLTQLRPADYTELKHVSSLQAEQPISSRLRPHQPRHYLDTRTLLVPQGELSGRAGAGAWRHVKASDSSEVVTSSTRLTGEESQG